MWRFSLLFLFPTLCVPHCKGRTSRLEEEHHLFFMLSWDNQGAKAGSLLATPSKSATFVSS